MSDLKIGLLGRMRSGKDAIGAYAAETHGLTRFAFADPLRKSCQALFPAAFENGRKPRALLQQYGQKLRELDPDIWLRLTLEAIDAQKGVQPIITDVRQPNEIQALREQGYLLIRVEASDQTRIERMLALGDDYTVHDLVHETELAIDGADVDYVLDNNGTLAEACQRLDELIEKGRRRWEA